MNKNFINRIQQIRRGSSQNPNQRGLVAHDNIYHNKTIEEQEEDGDHLPWTLMFEPCFVPLAF